MPAPSAEAASALPPSAKKGQQTGAAGPRAHARRPETPANAPDGLASSTVPVEAMDATHSTSAPQALDEHRSSLEHNKKEKPQGPEKGPVS